jgi:hypothetical protein
MCRRSFKNMRGIYNCITCCLLLLLGCSDIETKWSRKFDALGPGNYRINSAQSPKKEIYITGTYIDESLNTQCFTAKYNSEGRLQWHQAFEAQDHEQTIGTAMLTMRTQEELLTGRLDIYVLAQAANAQEQQKAILIQYDTLGNQQWHKIVNTSDGPMTSSLLSDHEGNIYVAGWEQDEENRQTIYLGKYTATGETQWFAKYYNEEIVFGTLLFDITAPDCFVIAGVLETTNNLFYLEYNGSGRLLRFVEHTTENQISEISDVMIDPTGNVYLSTTVQNQDTGNDFLVVAYDKNDSLLWAHEHNGEANGSDISNGLARDEALNIYVMGSCENEQGIPNIAIVKYDRNGNMVWASMHDQKSAAYPLMIEPRYLRIGERPHESYLYVAGTIGDNGQILRCNAEGVFSFQAEYGERGTVTKPTALSERCMALKRMAEAGSEALVVTIGPSAILGIARWD